MTITLGHWIIPVLLTLAIIAKATFEVRRVEIGVFGAGGVISLIILGVAASATLLTWLIYAAFLIWSFS